MNYIVKILFFIPFLLNINMASPVIQGTMGSSPFLSKHVDVLYENLHIKIDKNFEYADFNVEYHILSSKDGISIPLLFYASEYYEDFKITVDGKSVELLKTEDLFEIVDKEQFNDFSSLFDANQKDFKMNKDHEPNGLPNLQIKDFLYFKSDISQGVHKIQVSYRASRWTYKDSWLKSYSFRYALAPAKFWKSFGTLNVAIDATNFKEPIEVNIFSENDIQVESVTEMKFLELPADVLLINYNPRVSAFTQFLIDFGPFNLSLVVALILVVLHILMMKKYRKRFPNKKIAIPALVGGFFIPIAFVIGFILFNLLIDNIIGEHASGQYSYGAFYSIMNLPKYWIIYLIMAFIIDLFLKISEKRSSSQ